VVQSNLTHTATGGCTATSLACAAQVDQCLQHKGYAVGQKDREPASVPSTSANYEAFVDVTYAHTPTGVNDVPEEITKPGVDATIAIYATDEGARVAAEPNTGVAAGATFQGKRAGNVAYIAWQGDPSSDIEACATTK